MANGVQKKLKMNKFLLFRLAFAFSHLLFSFSVFRHVILKSEFKKGI